MNKLTVKSVIIEGRRIEVSYSVSKGLQQFFDTNDNVFWVEYSEDVYSTPTAIALVPFVCNVLPIIWLTDSLLELPEIDKAFYDSIPDIRRGYEGMYPRFAFRGKIKAEKIVDCNYPSEGGSAAFFSGGVDAFTTLIRHHDEKPLLLTIRGTDLRLSAVEGWRNVSEHVTATARQFGLESPIFVASNFRTFILDRWLSVMVVGKARDGWWHGFQHGIGILSMAAPIAWLRHLDKIYIASSNTAKDKVSCASDPTIDNCLRFGGSVIVHDGYELSRQLKIQTIVKYCKETSQTIEPRVCFVSPNGGNCCKCEKCIRTIYAILAENESPNRYGFHYTDEDLRNSKSIVIDSLRVTNDGVRGNWIGTINRFQETGAYKDDSRINWIYNLNPYTYTAQKSAIRKWYREMKRAFRVLLIRLRLLYYRYFN